MDHFAGLDVSVKETSICVVDDAGKIVREAKVASEPEALLCVLENLAYHFKRIGLEAGPLSQWLYSVLAEAGLPVICVETRHMQAVLKAQINKTDRNDALGIAQMMRVSCIAACCPSSGTRMCVPALDDDPWCWPGGRADLSRYGRCAGPLPELQGSRCCVWTDTRLV